MPRIIEGDLLARDATLGIVISRFNDFITGRLLEGALDAVQRHGGDTEKVTIAYVPGSVEIPITALKMAESGTYDAVVCLGCIIRGDTDHYDHVAQQATRGIGEVNLKTGVPTIFGIVTADNLDQAVERAGTKQGNAGARAVLTALEMVNLVKQL